jgi:hypothetical protein
MEDFFGRHSADFFIMSTMIRDKSENKKMAAPKGAAT